MRIITGCNVDLTLRLRAAAIGREIAADDVENVTFASATYARRTSGTDYVKAVSGVHQVGRRLAAFFETFDVFLSPTLCLPPLELGRLDTMTRDFEAYRNLIARYIPGTSMFNMSGQPSMSMPLAWSRSGLPLGMMFSARYGDEATLFRLASRLEQERPWKDRKPQVCG